MPIRSLRTPFSSHKWVIQVLFSLILLITLTVSKPNGQQLFQRKTTTTNQRHPGISTIIQVYMEKLAVGRTLTQPNVKCSSSFSLPKNVRVPVNKDTAVFLYSSNQDDAKPIAWCQTIVHFPLNDWKSLQCQPSQLTCQRCQVNLPSKTVSLSSSRKSNHLKEKGKKSKSKEIEKRKDHSDPLNQEQTDQERWNSIMEEIIGKKEDEWRLTSHHFKKPDSKSHNPDDNVTIPKIRGNGNKMNSPSNPTDRRVSKHPNQKEEEVAYDDQDTIDAVERAVQEFQTYCEEKLSINVRSDCPFVRTNKDSLPTHLEKNCRKRTLSSF